MVSPEYSRYEHIVRWPDLKMVREKGTYNKWHFNKTVISCKKGSGISQITGEAKIFKVWITQSLEKKRLYMLDKSGNEKDPAEICEQCAGKMMRLLSWSSSEEGNLEIRQQETRDELEERDFRAKGLLE